MAFIKKIATGDFLKEVVATRDFPPRSKYRFDGKVYLVKEAFESDNTKMRRVACMTTGEEEILTLNTLVRDLEDKNILLNEKD